MTPLGIVVAVLGAVWGIAADRIAARWPAHEDGSRRSPGWRTVVTVLTGAVGLGALTVRFDDPVAQAVFGAYVLALVVLLAVDLDQRLLPDELTLPAIPAALVFALTGLNPLVAPSGLPIAIAIAIAVPVVLLVVSLPFGAGAFGLGDVKLLLSVGLAVGPWRLISGVIDGVLAAGIVIVVLLVARRITLRTYVPFGPFLVFGALYALFVIR